MQTELAERFHSCVSDKQAKVASDKNVRLTYQALEFLHRLQRHKTSSVAQTGNRPPLTECTKACRTAMFATGRT